MSDFVFESPCPRARHIDAGAGVTGLDAYGDPEAVRRLAGGEPPLRVHRSTGVETGRGDEP